MFVDKVRIGATAVAVAARLGVVVVVVCGLVGIAAGIARVIRAGTLTEGLVVVIASTMTAVVSSVVMLFIAWRVELSISAGSAVEPDAGQRNEKAARAGPATSPSRTAEHVP